MENETTRLWSKKENELTVGESVKATAAIATVMVVAPVATLLAIGGVLTLIEKFQNRRKPKLEVVKDEEEN